MNTEDYTYEYDQRDISENSGMSLLSYLGFLWIIPMIFRMRKSPYTRFHVNQGLCLFIAEIVCSLLGSLLGALFAWADLIALKIAVNMLATLVSAFWLVLMVIGISNVINNRAKELPVIGRFRIIN